MPNDDLDNLTQEAYDAWAVDEPPAGFADRVLSELDRQEAGPPPLVAVADLAAGERSTAWPWRLRGLLVGVAVAAVAAAGAAIASRWADEGPATTILSPDGDPANIGLDAPARAESADDPLHALPVDLADKVDAHLAGYGRRYGEVFRYHGAVIISQAGEVVVRRSSGDAVRRGEGGPAVAHHPDTRLRIGTLSQQITASAILLLVDRGALRLDDAVREHLPDYPAIGERVTIRHLLSHTSGIPSFTDDPLFDSWKGEAHTTAELLARFQELPLEFPPGTDFDPSNSGYALLGAIIEAVSGVPHGEFIRREIFAPLGMTRSSVGDPAGVVAGRGYLFDEDEALGPVDPGRVDLSAFGAAGDVVTTADDLNRWASALFGGELLRPETVEQMITPVTDEGYGLGWILSEANGQRVVGHPGGSDGVNAAIRYYRTDKSLIVAIANNDVIDCRSVVEELGDLAHGRGIPLPTEYEEVAPEAARLPLYTGDFSLSEASREKLVKVFDAEEIERIARAQVLVDRGRLFFWVPGHGTKWMHARLGEADTFFFKDAAGTLATFQLQVAAAEHVVNPGEFRADGQGVAGSAAPGSATSLTLHQGGLDIVLERSPSGPGTIGVLPSTP